MLEEDDNPKQGSGDEANPILAAEETVHQETQVERQEEEEQEKGSKEDTEKEACTEGQSKAGVSQCDGEATAETESKLGENIADFHVPVVSSCAEKPDRDGSVADQEVEEGGSQIKGEKVRRVSLSAINWAVETDHLYSKPLHQTPTSYPKENTDEEGNEDIDDEEDNKSIDDKESKDLIDQKNNKEKGKALINEKQDKDLCDEEKNKLVVVNQEEDKGQVNEEGKDLGDHGKEKDFVEKEKSKHVVSHQEDKGVLHPEEKEALAQQKENQDSAHPEENKDSAHPEENKDSAQPEENKDLAHPEENKTLVHPEENKDLVQPEENQQDLVHSEENQNLAHPGENQHIANPGDQNLAHPEEDRNAAHLEEDRHLLHPEEDQDSALAEEDRDLALPEEDQNLAHPEENRDLTLPEEDRDLALQEEDEDLALPEEDQDSVLPEEDQDLTLPEEDGDLALPEEDRDLALQEEDRSLALPEEDRRLALPEEDRSLAPPEEDRSLALPEEDRSLAPPEEDRSLALPEEDRSLPFQEEDRGLALPEEDENLAHTQEDKGVVPQDEKKDLVNQEENLVTQEEKKDLFDEENKDCIDAEGQKKINIEENKDVGNLEDEQVLDQEKIEELVNQKKIKELISQEKHKTLENQEKCIESEEQTKESVEQEEQEDDQEKTKESVEKNKIKELVEQEKTRELVEKVEESSDQKQNKEEECKNLVIQEGNQALASQEEKNELIRQEEKRLAYLEGNIELVNNQEESKASCNQEEKKIVNQAGSEFIDQEETKELIHQERSEDMVIPKGSEELLVDQEKDINLADHVEEELLDQETDKIFTDHKENKEVADQKKENEQNDTPLIAEDVMAEKTEMMQEPDMKTDQVEPQSLPQSVQENNECEELKQTEGTGMAPPEQIEGTDMAPPEQTEGTATIPPPEQTEVAGMALHEQTEGTGTAMAPPEQSESTAMAPPEQSESTAMAPPEQSESTAMAPPEQSESTAMAPHEQTEDTSMAVPEQTGGIALVPPEQTEGAMAAPEQTEGIAMAPPEQTGDASMAPPEQTGDIAMAPPEQTEGIAIAPPEQIGDIVMATPEQTEDAMAPLDQTEGAMATPEQTEGAMATPEQTEGAMATSEQTEDAMAPLDQTEGAMAPLDQTEGAMAPLDQTEGAIATPEQTESAMAPEQTEGTGMAPPEIYTGTGHEENVNSNLNVANTDANDVVNESPVCVDSDTLDNADTSNDTELKSGVVNAEKEVVDSDEKSDLIIDTDATKGEETTQDHRIEMEEFEKEEIEKTIGNADPFAFEEDENNELEKYSSLELNESNGAGESEAINYELETKDLNGPHMNDPKQDFEEEYDGNSSISDSANLPQCRLKRNYSCMHCGINTQNPREYLFHLRDDHGENVKVFECPRCIYASKNHQKLIRHAKMVHKLKIKRLEASKTSPYKNQIKSPNLDFSPVKYSKSSGSKSSRSSPGRSPRHTEYPPDMWEEMEELEASLEHEESQEKVDEKGNKKVLRCEHCEFTCTSRKLLNKHETSYHLKRRFFRCSKCNYVTHLKGRYTKHMKYHQLPILKCDYCDFRTPYRWNLDRHLKNHTEDCGEYKCHLCNFTAQIKQSLTVHISNHHLTPEQIRQKELRRTIGISDPADCNSDDQEIEMLRMERDEHPDALILPGFSAPGSPISADASPSQMNGSNSFRVSNIDVSSHDDSQTCADEERDEDGEPKKKKPKIKITLTKMKTPKPKDTYLQELNERHNFEEDFIHPDDVVHRHGNVYIKRFKCKYCSFKAAFKNEVSRHEKKIHSIPMPKSEGTSRKAKKSVKSKLTRQSFSTSNDDAISQILQYPATDGSVAQPEPNLLDTESEPSLKLNTKVESNTEETLDDPREDNVSVDAATSESPDYSGTSKESSPSKDITKKKNPSFFDKLQEKMPTSNVQNLVCQFCGHESKCLSESVRHQKLHLSAKNIYASASLSTRCQFCRHRCKTTDDLMHHLKLCKEARKNQITDSGRRPGETTGSSRYDENEDSMSSGKGDNVDDDEENGDKDSTGDSKEESRPAVKEGSAPSLEGEAHPMENRVFVWNKIEKAEDEDQKSVDVKDKTELEEKEAVLKSQKKEEGESLKKSAREDSKSPVPVDEPLDYIESPIPQGQHFYSKRVYRCPQCSFWATTASRFHVHIVGHFNRKPYNCSECGYKSNWRWDITKHIKLKTSRDSSHARAEVIITDETGEKNYEKYDRYLSIIQLDETNAHKTEGGIPHRKRPKRTPEKEEPATEETTTTPTASPVRKPPMVAIPVMPRLQNLPRLTRAPTMLPTSQPGPMPFGPILRGPQMMVQFAGSRTAVPVNTSSPSPSPSPSMPVATPAGNLISARPPPPLMLRGAPRMAAPPPAGKVETESERPSVPGGQYEIITSQRPSENLLVLKSLVVKQCSDRMVLQGSVNTSLETLQLLASGSTNLSRLKKQPKGSLVDGQDKDSQVPVSHQMRLLAWLNLLAGEAEEKVSVSSTGEDGKEVAKMVLDHEGNPEWKCNSCDFRDSERETVYHHVRLAHTRNGPVSLLHAVHRCDLCGYAAGTKRAVQMHIDASHGGQGGITSRCEGQNPESKDGGEAEGDNEAGRSYRCRLCPFTCTKRSQMRPHLMYHVARPDCVFKCMFCPYYVPTKGELFEHLSLHDDCPWAVLDQASMNRHTSNTASAPGSSTQVPVSGGPRHFVCGLCPYESRSRSKLMLHRQFHKPKGLPFRCPHCSYNVTRRHLLSQHIRVHGLMDGTEATVATDNSGQVDERSNSPSPSLTITPVNNAATSGNTGEDTSLPDSAQLPKLLDESTINMEDIPLVWVSRDRRFFKMFKCRHCPHVNLRKTNIQEHEKMHKTNISKEAGGLHCPYCSYVSVNAGVMSAHLKVHGGSMGQCHAVVEPSLSDEEQLKQLTSRASTPSSELSQSSSTADDTKVKTDEKFLYYCQHCPARFFLEKEIQIHTRFHTTNLPISCEHCSYGAQQSAHLLTHAKVHTPEYQQRTLTMMSQHRTASNYPPIPGLTISLVDIPKEKTLQTSDKGSSQQTFIGGSTPTGVLPQPPPTSKYMCNECPASFSKQVTLQYHQSLHGAKNPHTCPRCSYAGKTEESLQQHIQLHTQHDQQAEKAAQEAKKMEQEALQNSIKFKNNEKTSKSSHPPIKLKLIGLRPGTSDSYESGGRPQFKYYVEEQVPLSGVDLLRRKTQLEREGGEKSYDASTGSKMHIYGKHKLPKDQRDMEEDDPKRVGNPSLHYPLHIDKLNGKSREKRYKCKKCPSAFEKVEQYNVHANLHGSNHKYRCRMCDYTVKFFANFMMHINRHKYHERVASQNGGLPAPSDTDPKYDPIIDKETPQVEKAKSKEEKENAKEIAKENANKENLEEADLTTIERQHLLIQNKKGVSDTSKKDEERERKIYYCQFCPYANVRRDACDSHSLRHQANGGHGSYKCTFCDYTASQPNFIREHTKVHFRPFKYVNPEGFMRHDRQELISTPFTVAGKSGDSNSDGGSHPEKSKFTVFANEMGNLKGVSDSKEAEDDCSDPPAAKRIKVNFHTGDIVDAPSDFVISLRPPRSRSSHIEINEMGVREASHNSNSMAKLHRSLVIDMKIPNPELQTPSKIESKKEQDSILEKEDKEKKEETDKETHMRLLNLISISSRSAKNKLVDKERLENKKYSMNNGPSEVGPQKITSEEPMDVDNTKKTVGDKISTVLNVPQPYRTLSENQ